MKNEKKDFINLLDDLCCIYKDYIDKHDKARLEIIIQDNMIDIKLYCDKELVDQFGLTFKQKEREQYIYICVNLMEILFGNKIVYCKDNIFYKNIDDNKLQIIVNDDDIFNRMFSYKSINLMYYDCKRKIKNRINKTSYVNNLESRVNISKKLVRSKK